MAAAASASADADGGRYDSGEQMVLVATDVAARGLDLPRLPSVVNFDLPKSAADYPHRVGRTGRAGASGVAISFVSAETAPHLRLIERRNRAHVPRERVAGFEPTTMRRSRSSSAPASASATATAPATAPATTTATATAAATATATTTATATATATDDDASPSPVSTKPPGNTAPGGAAGGVKGRRPSKKDKLRAAAKLSEDMDRSTSSKLLVDLDRELERAPKPGRRGEGKRETARRDDEAQRRTNELMREKYGSIGSLKKMKKPQ